MFKHFGSDPPPPKKNVFWRWKIYLIVTYIVNFFLIFFSGKKIKNDNLKNIYLLNS